MDAVRSAVEVQRGMVAQSANVSPDIRIEFRIGIHVGDIIIDENDIFGDGVNITARLEGIAEPGGICFPTTRTGKFAARSRSLSRTLVQRRSRTSPSPCARGGLSSAPHRRRRRHERRSWLLNRSHCPKTLHCCAAISKYEWRPRAGILRPRHERGHHYCILAFQRVVSDRTQLVLHL